MKIDKNYFFPKNEHGSPNFDTGAYTITSGNFGHHVWVCGQGSWYFLFIHRVHVLTFCIRIAIGSPPTPTISGSTQLASIHPVGVITLSRTVTYTGLIRIHTVVPISFVISNTLIIKLRLMTYMEVGGGGGGG